MDKNSIKSVLDGIVKSVGEKQVKLYKSLIDQSYINKVEDINDFYFALIYPFETFLSGLIKTEISQNEDIEFILKHSRFIENNFEKIIHNIEGMTCCADKTRFIMRGLFGFYKTKELIIINYDQEYTYHLPKKVFTDHNSIINFYEGLKHLYYGNPERYLTELLEIKKQFNTILK
jgi:hypothetical protein